MSMIGLLGLLVAFAGCVISVLCLGVAHILYKKRSFERSDTFAWGGRVAAVLTAVALTVCCAVLVWCFFSGDNTIQYVLDNRSTSTAPEAWLYKLAGLWRGSLPCSTRCSCSPRARMRARSITARSPFPRSC